jgi:hypothetical protein
MSERIAIVVGAIEAAVVAIIGVIAYILNWDSEFAALIVAAASAIIIGIGTIYTFTQTTANVEVERRVNAAYKRGKSGQ